MERLFLVPFGGEFFDLQRSTGMWMRKKTR
jgi:hypothetical protein